MNLSLFKFGVEVEKEDGSVKRKYLSHPTRAKQALIDGGWLPHGDGSLNEDGIEISSKVMALFDREEVEACFKAAEEVIDGDYSHRCGGHMSLSYEGMSGQKFYWTFLYHWMPLLYSLYSKREDGSYSQFRTAESTSNMCGKSGGINIFSSGRVELRLFPAIENMKQLKWRTELLRLIVSSGAMSYSDSMEILKDPASDLSQHLALLGLHSEKRLVKVKKYKDKYLRLEPATAI